MSFKSIKKFFKYLKSGHLWIGPLFLTCPFNTWWKCRKYWHKPKFLFYAGRIGQRNAGYYEEDCTIKNAEGKPLYKKGDKRTEQCGVWPFVSWNCITNNMPKWRQKIFPLTIISRDICWKDKYNEPRYEYPGIFSLIWGTNINKAWQFCMLVQPPVLNSFSKSFFGGGSAHGDSYWETMLWYLNYCDKDFKKAYETWPNGHWIKTVRIGENEDGSPIFKEEDTGPSWHPLFFKDRGLKIMNEVKPFKKESNEEI